MTHASRNAIQHLKKLAEKMKISNDELILKINECELCVLFKVHRVIFRSSDNAESSDKFFFRVTYDLMQLDFAFNRDE
jgi:hypothetical protein